MVDHSKPRLKPEERFGRAAPSTSPILCWPIALRSVNSSVPSWSNTPATVRVHSRYVVVPLACCAVCGRTIFERGMRAPLKATRKNADSAYLRRWYWRECGLRSNEGWWENTRCFGGMTGCTLCFSKILLLYCRGGSLLGPWDLGRLFGPSMHVLF